MLWQFQSDLYNVDKSGSSSGENLHNRSLGTGPSAVVLKTLLQLEREAESDSGFLSRLS